MAVSVGSGIGSSVGMAKESAWGTFTTPTKWPEFENETLEWKPKRIVGTGLANGNLVQRNSTRQTVTSTVQGDLRVPVYYKGMGLLLGSIMGSLGVAPVQQGGTSAYLQTHALALSAMGQSLTIQKGVPDVTTGTIHQYNYVGCKVTKAVFEVGVDQFMVGTFTLDGKNYDTSNAYGTPVYVTPNPIHSFNTTVFQMGAFGSEVTVEGVRKATLTIERPYRVDNFYLDGTGLKQEQVQNNFVKITLDLESDYVTDSAFVAQFNTDTAQSIIIKSTGPVIPSGGSNNFYFQAAIPNMRWETGQPLIAGPDEVMPKMQLIGLYDDSHTAATLSYMSTDVAL